MQINAFPTDEISANKKVDLMNIETKVNIGFLSFTIIL